MGGLKCFSKAEGRAGSKQPRALRGQSLYGVDGGVELERVCRELQRALLWELFSVALDGKSFGLELGWLLSP